LFSQLMAQPIGILGGTFDPVHHGHLRLALEVFEALQLQEVRLIPAKNPPHRNTPVADSRHRSAMLQQAINGTRGLVIDERELHREGNSYTVDSVADIRAEAGDQPLCLIMGMDAFQALDTWHRWQQLTDFVHIVVVNRPGSDAEITQADIAALYTARKTGRIEDLNRRPAGYIFKIRLPMLDISSTRIRDLLQAQQNIRYLVPDDVLAYITKEQLYQ
jgi:nicotinate-nucleotide adenylyltransferase